ncbi:sugar ABC transporter ATP-binding protein [Shimia sp. Alg240-R146]|uniref:sugar ABC transporter ATP-binding protein n=1 Tax=Shimia sp. Alg240-R146 TaxID=2993449 RepID=UPI0022E2E072|nr:sugar ABC transporter ATP-binding protein [Shimia sp. Alg240-R146]
MSKIAFETRSVSKFFPGVKALQGVSMQMRGGSIHALLGENGAGKSTLIKLITGVYRPDEGQLFAGAEPVNFTRPHDAIAAGVGVVHQERNLIPRFSVAENMALSQLADRTIAPIDYAALNEQAEPWLDMLGLDVEPATQVSRLSVAQMQMVEIAKALSQQTRVLLLDEPTASLTPMESKALFDVLHRLRDDGVSMLFVSHKLEEVKEICDTVSVLRDGVNAGENIAMDNLERQDLIRLMIGREQNDAKPRHGRSGEQSVALELKDVSTSLGHKGINLEVKRHEIVGLYGLVGAGRTELAKAIMGAAAITEGEVLRDGQTVEIDNPTDALHGHRIGYVSENRKDEGLILEHSVLENAGITIWRKSANRLGWLTGASVKKRTVPFLEKLAVKTPSLNQTVGNLSGGNQQKIAMAKWLAAGVKVLIVDEPTVGIDVKSKAYLHELLHELANDGTAVLLITSDLPEMISLADRILVMDEFVIKGDVKNTGDYKTMSQSVMEHIHHTEDELRRAKAS